jgi:hypothetical protein
MAKRNRIIYASQSVYCNGEVLYRVQTMGSTTTFTSTDIFELGHLDVIDVVDDVPAVAVTLNTNDWGDVRTFALLAQVSDAKLAMSDSAISANANLAVVSGTQMIETGKYLHGACLADFAITCGNLPGVSMWSPIQSECDMGTLSDNIDQTMFLDDVYVNRVEFNYSTGAEATENYTGETDNKMWLLNTAKFINYQQWDLDGAEGDHVVITTDGGTIATLSDGSLAFMRTSEAGYRGVVYYDNVTDPASPSATVCRVEPGTIQHADYFVYNDANDFLYFPSGGPVTVSGNVLDATFAMDQYNNDAANCYFQALSAAERYPVGALRQGQVELYIVGRTDTSYRGAWRLTSAVVGADLTREPLSELGHLNPYDRPLTLPIPVTANLETTAGDLEHWSVFADKYADYDSNALLDLDLTNLMTTDYLNLVIMVYAQTDEEAGGSGEARKVLAGSDLIGKDYMDDGVPGTYSVNNTERPLKTIIVNNLKITEEGCNLDVGTNATQTFNFKTNNDVFVVKGGIPISRITNENCVRRNT